MLAWCRSSSRFITRTEKKGGGGEDTTGERVHEREGSIYGTGGVKGDARQGRRVERGGENERKKRGAGIRDVQL